MPEKRTRHSDVGASDRMLQRDGIPYGRADGNETKHLCCSQVLYCMVSEVGRPFAGFHDSIRFRLMLYFGHFISTNTQLTAEQRVSE